MTTDALLRRNRELSILTAIAEGLNRAVDLREALGCSAEFGAIHM